MPTIQELFEIDKSKSKYLILSQDEKVRAKFIKVEPTVTSYGPAKKYTFEVRGVTKEMNTGSKRLLTAMYNAKVREGDLIEITRTGEAYSTDYIIKNISKEENKDTNTA